MRPALLAVTLAGLAAACGAKTPTEPSGVDAGGLWIGLATQTSVSGGECVGLVFQQSNGASDRLAFVITQSGNSLAAAATSETTGQSCSYEGTVMSSSVALNATGCQFSGIQVQCLNGDLRDIYLVAQNVTGTMDGNTLSGAISESWNVFVRGTTTNGLGSAVVNSSFTLSR